TGYGYGTDDGIAGSERLMVYLTQELGRSAGVPIGMALRNAKLRYMQGLPHGGLTPYDAKSILEAALYGLPMYMVNVPNTLNAPDFTPPITSTQIVTNLLSLKLLEQYVYVTPELHEQGGNTGIYYSIGASDLWTHGTTGRPLLPSAAVQLPQMPAGGNWIPRGVVLRSATLTPVEGVDPVVTRPVTDTAQGEPLLNEGLGWSSPQLFTINGFEEGPSSIAGTFALYNASSGEMRLVSHALIDILYTRPWNEDFSPPRILTAEALRVTGTPTVTLEATAEDSEGFVKQFYFTFITPERIWSIPLVRDPNDPSGQHWTGAVEDIPPDARYVLQAVDEAGNVAMAMNKGDYIPLNSEIRFVYLPLVLRESSD
ncbi:MAG: hypothetical protein ACK2UI_08335, partial [Anaerolineae bacterium]